VAEASRFGLYAKSLPDPRNGVARVKRVRNSELFAGEMSVLSGENMSDKPELEMFENPRVGRDYVITTRCPEFTSVCPVTGQPDFGEILIEYTPDELCIELKSLKFYMQSYRNQGIFYERLTNDILDDLVAACKPKWMRVTSKFTPRGGISTDVCVEHTASA